MTDDEKVRKEQASAIRDIAGNIPSGFWLGSMETLIVLKEKLRGIADLLDQPPEPEKKMRWWGPSWVHETIRTGLDGTRFYRGPEKPDGAWVEVTITPVEAEHRHECRNCGNWQHAWGCRLKNETRSDECRTCGGGS